MYMSSLLITLLLIALVEPCSCWVCPKASDSSSALSYSLQKPSSHSSDTLQGNLCGASCRVWDVAEFCQGRWPPADLAKATSRQAAWITTSHTASQLKTPLIWWCDIRKTTDQNWSKPWVRHSQLLRATAAFSVYVFSSPYIDDAATTCDHELVSLEPLYQFPREVSCSSHPWGASILAPSQVPGDSGFSSLWIRRASDLHFSWITCHQL